MLPQPLNPIVFSLFRGYNKRFLFLSLFLLLFILIILSHISFLLLSSSYFSSFLLQSFSLLLSSLFSSSLLFSLPNYIPFLIFFPLGESDANMAGIISSDQTRGKQHGKISEIKINRVRLRNSSNSMASNFQFLYLFSFLFKFLFLFLFIFFNSV